MINRREALKGAIAALALGSLPVSQVAASGLAIKVTQTPVTGGVLVTLDLLVGICVIDKDLKRIPMLG